MPEVARATRWLPLADVARRTGRNQELLRRWCAAGRIRCQRLGRDWMIDPADLAQIEGMPRRGVNRRGEPDLADLGVLAPGLADAVRECLEPGETVREVIPGIEDSALIATDGRLFMARDGVLVSDPETGQAAAWPLDWVRRIQLTAGSSAGAVVLTPRDPADRALVVVIGRPHLARSVEAVAALRARLVERGNFADD